MTASAETRTTHPLAIDVAMSKHPERADRHRHDCSHCALESIDNACRHLFVFVLVVDVVALAELVRIVFVLFVDVFAAVSVRVLHIGVELV